MNCVPRSLFWSNSFVNRGIMRMALSNFLGFDRNEKSMSGVNSETLNFVQSFTSTDCYVEVNGQYRVISLFVTASWSYNQLEAGASMMVLGVRVMPN